MAQPQKYDPPHSPPPPAYGTPDHSSLSHPQAAHVPPQSTGNTNSTDYYGASPYQTPQPQHQYPYPPQTDGYPPQNNYPPQQGGGYYAPGPQMGYAQQQGGGYGPQGGYYGPGPQQGYGPGPYGPQGGYYGQPQGQYVDQRRGGSPGFMEAMLASLACCCCLDACLLF